MIRQSHEGYNVAFIPSALDDAKLDPYAFRVYAHLARRANKKTGEAWPSLKSVGERTSMSPRKVRDCLRELERRNMLCTYTVANETGQKSNSYELTPFEEWDTPPGTECLGGRHEVPGGEAQGADPHYKEGTPKKEKIPSPKKLSETEKKMTRVEVTPLMQRIGAFFGRKGLNAWSLAAKEALDMIRPSDEEIEAMEEYYLAVIPKEQDYRRKKLITLLHNWIEDLDTVILWKFQQP